MNPAKPPSTRIKLFSLAYWLYLVASLTVFWFAVVIPWLLITPFDRRRLFAHWYAYTWANHLHACLRFGRSSSSTPNACVTTRPTCWSATTNRAATS